MDTLKEMWAIVLLAAVPIAGLVGFIVHALTVRKSSLEIQKLRYEIGRLKSDQSKRESLIEIANFDQIMQFADKGLSDTAYRGASAHRRELIVALVLFVVAIVVSVVYLFFYGAAK